MTDDRSLGHDENHYPRFHRAVSEIRNWAREFKCIGVSPPHDHPRVYMNLGVATWGSTSRSLLELAIGIARGFIAATCCSITARGPAGATDRQG